MPGPAAASKLRSHILSAVGRRRKILVWIPRRSGSVRRGIKPKSSAGPYNSAKAAECLHFHIGSRTRASHASKERSRLPRCRAPTRGAAAGTSSSHKLIVFPGMQLGSARSAHGQPCRTSRGCVFPRIESALVCNAGGRRMPRCCRSAQVPSLVRRSLLGPLKKQRDHCARWLATSGIAMG